MEITWGVLRNTNLLRGTQVLERMDSDTQLPALAKLVIDGMPGLLIAVTVIFVSSYHNRQVPLVVNRKGVSHSDF